MAATDGDRPSTDLAARLGIGAGMRVALLHAGEEFEAALGALPEGATVQHGLRRTERMDLLVGFVTERSHVARNIPWLLDTIEPGGGFWLAHPSASSSRRTDLDDRVLAELAEPFGWVPEQTCEIDEGWTAVKLVRATP